MSNLGYPGVNGPDAPKQGEKRVEGTVLGSDAVNSLVRTSDGQTVIVNNSTGQRAGNKR